MKAVVKISVIIGAAILVASCAAVPRLPYARKHLADNTTMTALNPRVIEKPATGAGDKLFRAMPCDSTPEGRLARDVEFLSSGLCEGRGFGSRGAVQACSYIFEKMEAIGLPASIQTFSANGSTGRNVIAEIPGSDVRPIVIMAYYDGLGANDRDFYPGADANASGVAALLELARAIPRQGRHPVVIAAIDGHTVSMAGAAELLKKYPRPFLVVNLDTVGSTLAPVFRLRPDFLICLGGMKYSMDLFDANNAGPRLHLTFDYYGSERFTALFYRSISDQRAFLAKGIPCVMFTSGITFNTNKLTDTCETLDYQVLARRVALVSSWLAKMNNSARK